MKTVLHNKWSWKWNASLHYKTPFKKLYYLFEEAHKIFFLFELKKKKKKKKKLYAMFINLDTLVK